MNDIEAGRPVRPASCLKKKKISVMPAFLKIIHLTDLHLKAPGGDVLGIDPARRLATVIASINRNHADAALCVVTGDLADLAEPAAYRLAREMLAGLVVPVALTLGNHDARAPFRESFPLAPESPGGFVQSAVDLGPLAVVVIDTLDEEQRGVGRVCVRRLAWLEATLGRLKPKPVIVFMHHPPMRIGLPWFDPMLIGNGDEVLALLHRHDHVAHLAFGHVHVNVSGVRHGLSFSGSRGTCHKILARPTPAEALYADQGAAYDMLLFAEGLLAVHSIDPAGPNRLIGRETPTPDERGAFEMLRGKTIDNWM